MNKRQKYFHKVSEKGNLEARIVTEYLKDGKVVAAGYSPPMSPADAKDMTGWDDRSKDIALAITDIEVLADLNAKKQVVTGIGIEEIVTYEREIEEDGKIAIYSITRIFDGGVEKSKKPCLISWIMPGDDPNGADLISKALAVKLHTPEVIAAYQAAIAELEAEK